MKRLLLISMIAGMLPLSLVAQDDDLYFVPKKKSVEKVTDNYGVPANVYYSGSNRSIDEYNRRTKSHYEVIGADSTLNDTISFSAEVGVYPDSISDEDFKLTKKMSRFEDYRLSDNAAFWAGYNAGRYDWAWHSPWYYTRYGWYDPWYYGRWSWYDPWYYGYGWYSPWYYSWYSPYYGWYDPWYYGYSWYAPGYYTWYGVGRVSPRYANTIGAGTIRRDGMAHANYRRAGSSSRYSNGSRVNNELRNRTVNGSSRSGRVNRGESSRTYSESSRYNSGNYNGNVGSSRSSGGSSFGGSRSSGGGFSGGGFSGGSRGGGGGGSRMGGRR